MRGRHPLKISAGRYCTPFTAFPETKPVIIDGGSCPPHQNIGYVLIRAGAMEFHFRLAIGGQFTAGMVDHGHEVEQALLHTTLANRGA